MSYIDRKLLHLGTALAAITVSGAFSPACGNDSQKNTTQGIATPALSETTIHSLDSQLVTQALKSSRLSEKQSTRIVSNYDKKETTIANYTNVTLNETAIQEIYQTVEDLVSIGLRIPTKIEGNDKSLVIDRKRQTGPRNVFIVPKDVFLIPGQIQAPPELLLNPAFTVIDTKNGASITILRYIENQGGYIKDSPQFITFSFAIEACQSLALAAILEQAGPTRITPANLQFAQELACNSFGFVIASAAIGKDYNQYREEVLTHALPFGPDYKKTNRGDYPLIVFPEQIYSRLPKTGTIVTSR